MGNRDTYTSFAELKRHESDWHIETLDRSAAVTVLAPHGGRIEPHTSEIARLIAGDDCNLFCFNGSKAGCNRILHITSHRYDEERALTLVRQARSVVAVHGCTRPEPLVLLGGRDVKLLGRIEDALERRTIPVRRAAGGFAGTHADNICNRGSTGAGVQLEISRGLRDAPAARRRIAAAVRAALQLP